MGVRCGSRILRANLFGGEDGVGDGEGLDGGTDGVDADDVRSGKGGGDDRSQSGVVTLGGRERRRRC